MNWSSTLKRWGLSAIVVLGVAALVVVIYELDEIPPFKGFI